ETTRAGRGPRGKAGGKRGRRAPAAASGSGAGAESVSGAECSRFTAESEGARARDPGDNPGTRLVLPGWTWESMARGGVSWEVVRPTGLAAAERAQNKGSSMIGGHRPGP